MSLSRRYFQRLATPSAAKAAIIEGRYGTAEAVPFQSRALKQYFQRALSKKSEDEASQLNRLGETRQAASLLQSFRRRTVVSTCGQSRPVSDASEDAIGFRTSSN